jgi:hypothetical protein
MPRRLAQFAAEGETVEAREVHVEHEDVPGVVSSQGKSLQTARRSVDDEPGEAQRRGDEIPNRFLVFDDKNALLAGSWLARAHGRIHGTTARSVESAAPGPKKPQLV